MTSPTPPTVHQLDAVSRSLAERVVDGRALRVSVITQTYDTTVADLWEACTSPERVARWFLPVSGELREGGRYQLEGNAGGTVTSCEPPARFTATWEFGDQVSWIEVRVSEDGDGARLELEHSAPREDLEEFWSTYGPGATGVGWDLGLLGLATHLRAPDAERGDTDAWAAGPEGVAFATRSSRLWADASIAAGTPEEDARAAQDRTTAFYTGRDQPT